MHLNRDIPGIKTVGDLKRALEGLDDNLEIQIDLNPTSHDLDNIEEFPFHEIHVIGYGSGDPNAILSHIEICSWYIDENADRLWDISFEKRLKQFRNIKDNKGE